MADNQVRMGVYISMTPLTPSLDRSATDMKCPRCGNDNPEDARFCGVCGTSLGAYTAGDSTSQGMVSFPDAIRLGFQHYFDFRSRSTRAEFWWWALFAVLADVILSVVDMRMGTFNVESGNGLISGLFSLGLFIPGLALGARRLHDINRTGWWQLMWFVFFLVIPMIILLWWAAKPSDEGTNKHGPTPPHDTPPHNSLISLNSILAVHLPTP
jgi:uncharacterized membrane protein YhaH (DUF805 family)